VLLRLFLAADHAADDGAGLGRDLPDVDDAGRAVQADPVAFLQRLAAGENRLGLVVDGQFARAGDAAFAPAARHDGRVRGHAARARQDALRRPHAADILGARLVAHENQLRGRIFLDDGFRGMRVEHDLADARARTGRQALGQNDGLFLGRDVEDREQQLFEIRTRQRGNRLVRLEDFVLRLAGEEILAGGHFHRPADAGQAGALGVAGLQHPQRALLDREFHVLGILVVLLQLLHDGHELGVGLLPDGAFLLGHLVNVLRRADAGYDVFALRVDQVLAHRGLVAGGAVACEGHARAGLVAHVAVNHRADVDGRPEQARHLVDLAVFLRAIAVPAAKHRVNAGKELLEGILREGLFHLLHVDLLIDLAQFLELFGRQVGVFLRAVLLLQFGHCDFEVVVRQAGRRSHDHVAEHVDEAAVAVPACARVAGALDEAQHRLVVQAEIENGIHHARHGNRGARTHRHQQGVLGIAQLLLHLGFELLELGLELLQHPLGIFAFVRGVIGARFGRDREARRHRQARVRHFGEVGALAAEDRLHRGIAFGVLFPETIKIDIFFLGHVRLRVWVRKPGLF